MNTAPAVVWTIAGFDPSSGAGITADLKTIASHGLFGCSAITALTVQNTMGVRRVEAVASRTLRDSLEVLLEDMSPNAIKIGMLATAENVAILADFLSAAPLAGCPVVLDPVLCSSSGTELLSSEGRELLSRRLLPLVTVVTPNRQEAALLTGLPLGDAEALAITLRSLGPRAAIVTGGDPLAPSETMATDTLAYELGGMEFVESLSAPRIDSRATHGTGCALSTALACHLALGRTIPMAATAAKAFVARAIELAPGLGHGRGPLGLEKAAE